MRVFADFDLSAIGLQLAAILGGVFALHVFYRAVQTNWPQSYMSVSDFTGQLVSTSLARYAAYRVLPVLAVTFFVAGSLRGADRPYLLSGIAIAASHAVITNGIAAWGVVRFGRQRFGFLSNLVFHVVAGIGTIVGGVAGVVIARSDDALLLLPTPRELSATLWTAIAAALLGAYIVRISANTSADPLRKSRSAISAELWSTARLQSLANGADPAIVKAILVVENMQRPQWIRRLESIKGRLGFAGTYGIMQVASDALLDDAESIQRACEGHLSGARPVRDSRGHADWESLREIARRHNADPAFVEFVATAFWQVDDEEAAFRAGITLTRDGRGVHVENVGGGPASGLRVYRVDLSGDPPGLGRSELLEVDQGRATIGEFEEVGAADLPQTSQWEWPSANNGDWLVRASWVNSDSTPGDTGWTVATPTAT